MAFCIQNIKGQWRQKTYFLQKYIASLSLSFSNPYVNSCLTPWSPFVNHIHTAGTIFVIVTTESVFLILSVLQMFDIMKRHSANLVSNMKKKADKDESLDLKE